eukprot:m.115020 g.115020  ORF g.115020 m.115020 type:complete len:603 (+) comp37531_c0_seq1:1350-3158(+)
MTAYAAIYEHLRDDVLPYAKQVEKDFDDYQSKATSMERHLSIAQNSIQHVKFLVEVCNRRIGNARHTLTQLREELRQMQKVQAQSLYRSESASEVCQSAVKNYIIHKDAFTLGDIFKIIFSAIKVVVDGILIALDVAEAVDGDFNPWKTWKDVTNFASDTTTLVKNIVYVADANKRLATDEEHVADQFKEIRGQIDQTGKENSAKMLVDAHKFDQMIQKWLFLPDCKESKADFTAYINISGAVNDKIMQHDSLVIEVAKLEAIVALHQAQAAQLQSHLSENFNPFTLTYVQSIESVYFALKNSIVNELKKMQEAYNYQFLEAKPFSYDDSRIAMIEARMANNRIEMLDRMSELGWQVQEFNKDAAPMTNTIVLKREDLLGDFNQLDATGQMAFVISGDEPLLASLTHVQMTGLKVWLPGIHSSSDKISVWVKRFGSSRVYDQQGQLWSFTHNARTMLFVYNKNTLDINVPISRIQQSEEQDEFVAMSPIGPWLLSVSRNYNTRKVKEIHVQLSGTFLPCAEPTCPPRKEIDFEMTGTPTVNASSSVPITDSRRRETSHNRQVPLILGIVAGIFTLIGISAVVVLFTRRYRRRRGYHQIPGAN